jgi:hypothetical protein
MSEPRAPYGRKDFEIFVPHEYKTPIFHLKRTNELRDYIYSTAHDKTISEERRKEIFDSSFPLFEYWDKEFRAMKFVS